MKNFLILPTLLFPLISLCQLSLTKTAYEPVIGEMEWRSDQFDSVAPLPRNEGGNQLWDFSQVIIKTAGPQRQYGPPANSYFGGSIQLGNEYFISNTNSFQLIGSGIQYTTNTPQSSTKYSKGFVELLWPTTYQTFFKDTAKSASSGWNANISSTSNEVIAYSIEGTGTGTLVMPGGSIYTNVLQVKKIVSAVSTLSQPFKIITGYDYTSYSYYHSSSKVPILTMTVSFHTANSTPNYPKLIQLQVPVFLTTVGLNKYDNGQEQLRIFPIPAKDKLILTFPASNELQEISIAGLDGRVILSEHSDRGAEKSEIDISHLVQGIYFVTVKNPSAIICRKMVVE